MTGITATEARSKLYRLIDETAESHQPIVIMGKRNKAVLVSEEDWSAIQESYSCWRFAFKKGSRWIFGYNLFRGIWLI
jgi:prevent-host-death family protein